MCCEVPSSTNLSTVREGRGSKTDSSQYVLYADLMLSTQPTAPRPAAGRFAPRRLNCLQATASTRRTADPGWRRICPHGHIRLGRRNSAVADQARSSLPITCRAHHPGPRQIRCFPRASCAARPGARRTPLSRLCYAANLSNASIAQFLARNRGGGRTLWIMTTNR